MTELAAGQVIQLSDGRNGIIRFVGQTHFAPGDWVGVELDDGTGKNDGSVQGERYFDCTMGHGMFVRPVTVTVLAQPAPAPAPAPRQPPAVVAAAPTATKKTARPSSMFTSGSSRGASGDPALGKRMSLNAASPSPVPRPNSRPSSIARSPTKSPTKQLATAASSANTSRTGTPSNSRVSSAAPRPRPSAAGTTRTSMGPPPIPAPKAPRQPISSSASSRTAGGAPARTLSGRMTTAGRAIGARSSGLRKGSADSQSGTENGSVRGITSPQKSDDDAVSPPRRGPVQSRTAALEKITAPGSASSKQAATSSPAAASRQTAANAAAANREIEDLKAKLRVLERKRMEDREKLKQMEKIQGERDKFESIIQKLQIKYQPQQQENNELRKLLKEAEARLESVESLQAEHESEMELATLDREMAEEMTEVYKTELEALKQKAEELELEVDILREENAEFTKGMSPEDRASTGWLQMERNNERLREALIRLRDLTQQQEEELQQQIKSLEEDVQELGQVKEHYEAAKEKLAQSEAAVEDLRQQLDNALGAEDMIEDLTERNMSQAEQIEELKAVVEDLESLKEINDELEINHVQNEKEMQEELDFKDSVIVEQAKRAGQQQEAVEDMEYTLSRFRELVTSLQTDLEDMRASHAVTETESEQLNSKSRAMLDLNMKLQISAAKAQVKTIDLELRRLEAQEAKQHLEIVKLFLPDSYKADRDSVLALLRFRRLAFKANLLNGFVKERINGQAQPGHEDDIFAGCDAVDKLTWVSAMCDRFVNCISHCSLEQFAKFEGALFELEPVERALNGWIDGLRRDELKEKQCASELQRTIALMTHLAEVHIAPGLESYADDVYMRTILMQSHLESAATMFLATRNMVQGVITDAGGDDELAQHFARKSEAVVTQTRSAKVIAGKAVRALEDLRTRSLSLMPDTMEAFENCETATRELTDLASKIGLDLHQVLHEEGRAEPYTYLDVQTSAHKSAMAVTGSSESDLFSAYLTKLRVLTGQVADVAALTSDLSQTQEFERSEQPWKLRALELKALKTIPVDAEEELRHLKEEYSETRRTVAMRDESLSTAYLKIETLESRMRDANAKASKIADLEAQIESSKQAIAGLHEDIEKQDRELKNLEGDRDKWKKIAGDTRALAGDAPGSKAGQERAVATAREMDALKDEIASLESAVRYLREDNRRARVTEQRNYDWLAEPLKKAAPVAEQRRALVAAEGRDVLGELVKMATSAKVFDLASLPTDKLAWRPAKTTPQYQAARQMEDLAVWKSWQDNVVKKSRVLMGQQQQHQQLLLQQQQSHQPGARRTMRNPAARLQIRLPGMDGKVIPGAGGGQVQIVGSREWEGLQGRVAVV